MLYMYIISDAIASNVECTVTSFFLVTDCELTLNQFTNNFNTHPTSANEKSSTINNRKLNKYRTLVNTHTVHIQVTSIHLFS